MRDRFRSGGGIISTGMRTVVRITMQLNEVDWMSKDGKNHGKMFILKGEGVSRSFF
jgi:hypothetical protein